MARLGRINVPLDEREVDVLIRMADADCREPRDQIRFLIQQEARRRGLWNDQPASKKPTAPTEADTDSGT